LQIEKNLIEHPPQRPLHRGFRVFLESASQKSHQRMPAHFTLGEAGSQSREAIARRGPARGTWLAVAQVEDREDESRAFRTGGGEALELGSRPGHQLGQRFPHLREIEKRCCVAILQPPRPPSRVALRLRPLPLSV